MGGFLCFQMDSVLHILHVQNLNLAMINCSEVASMVLLSRGRCQSIEKVDVEWLCKDSIISV